MLRSWQFRKRTTKSFICIKCLTSLHQPSYGPQSPLDLYGRRTKARPRTTFCALNSVRPVSSVAQTGIPDSKNPVPFPTLPIETTLRQRLRQWEIENSESFVISTVPIEDLRKAGGIVNSMRSRKEDIDIAPDDTDVKDLEDCVPTFDRDDLADVGAQRHFLLPGDLVELRFRGDRNQELAIFVRDLESQGQYYTMSGRWIHRATNQPKFYVPNFVKSHELEGLLPYLPETDVAKNMEDRLHQFQQSPPRHASKNLLVRMDNFWRQAESTYLRAASSLEDAHKQLAHAHRLRYATLEEIADILLGPSIARQADGAYSKSDLYAVHRAILFADIGFRVQPKGTLRAGGYYEILSLSEVRDVNEVVGHLRAYINGKLTGMLGLHGEYTHKFIRKCQVLIDQSRMTREFTQHGAIGPSSKTLKAPHNYRRGTLESQFSSIDELFIKFVESWACLQNFPGGSHLHGVASSLLRAVGRYDDVLLDPKTGWTFLQEIGAIAPWETLSPYALRLPFTGRRLQGTEPHLLQGYTKDRLESLRRDWRETTVFCIDNVGALEIDDGISIETTDTPDEYWIHTHVADPAAHLEDNSSASKYAERMMQNVYLPDRNYFIFNEDFVHSKLSLASGRPCLTFSARLNLEGDILDHKVSAGIIRNVLYITPSDWEEVATGHPQRSNEAVYVAGSGSTSDYAPSRTMTPPQQLSVEHVKQLKLLHQFGKIRGEILQSRGGWNYGRATPTISVHFDGLKEEKPPQPTDSSHSFRHFGDPAIRLAIPKSLEQNNGCLQYIMLLAGEVCAIWCHARGIPIPYRITPVNPGRDDPAEYFTRVLIPSKNEQGVPPPEISSQYLRLIGAAQPSLTPGPHLGVGAAMLTKCTSPLRRFPDFLVHAQIGATLREEARLGRSLIGNTSEEFLPYSAACISALLPQIDTRERTISKYQHVANSAWVAQFVLRAWRFKEAALPSTLTFVVGRVIETFDNMNGWVEELSCPAVCASPKGVKLAHVKPEERFEAEIADVDVYHGIIRMQALRRTASEERPGLV